MRQHHPHERPTAEKVLADHAAAVREHKPAAHATPISDARAT